MKKLKRENGITLVALVITIVVLIILAGIAISMTIGENGIFTRAKEAKRLQITSEAKEKIGADILDAQIEATQKDEELQQSKVEEIIAKYGELQADGDTIKLKDNGYEISLKEIYNGTTSSSGGSTGGSTGIAELDSIKAELAQTTATEDKILKDYKAYSNGKLMTGTMENYSGQTVTASTITKNGENAEITIPSAGYYGTDSKVSIPINKINSNSVRTAFVGVGYVIKDNKKTAIELSKCIHNENASYTQAILSTLNVENQPCSAGGKIAAIGYDFTDKVEISVCSFYINCTRGDTWDIYFTLQYSDDGISWSDASDKVTGSPSSGNMIIFSKNSTKARYWRLYMEGTAQFEWTGAYATRINSFTLN